MIKPSIRSRHMLITVDTRSGKIVKVVDDSGRKGTKVSLTAIDKIHKSPRGLRWVGTILHSHSSPGCAIVIIGGSAIRICS